jgi:hypothetical protein
VLKEFGDTADGADWAVIYSQAMASR